MTVFAWLSCLVWTQIETAIDSRCRARSTQLLIALQAPVYRTVHLTLVQILFACALATKNCAFLLHSFTEPFMES